MTERDNEKEIILGNGQLTSLFFVVVALCGVFFTLGYMIGRNSGHPASAPEAAAPAPATTTPTPSPTPTPAPADADVPKLSSNLPDTPPPPIADAPPPAVQTQAAREVPQPQPEQSKPAPDRTTSKPVPAAPPAPPPAQPASVSEIKPREPGATYLQVAALRHDDATKLVRTLREQDLPAQLAESSRPGFFRVLVGPYRQPAQVADTKAKLKTLGFAGAFVAR